MATSARAHHSKRGVSHDRAQLVDEPLGLAVDCTKQDLGRERDEAVWGLKVREACARQK